MPTYEYACKSCGEHIEVVQSFRDEALTECAACGGPLRKVFGSVGITFKGSGFYKTDSRGGSKSSSSPGKSTDGKSTDTKASDSKASDGKASDGKSTDGKSTDSKSSDSKSSDSSGSSSSTKSSEAKTA